MKETTTVDRPTAAEPFLLGEQLVPHGAWLHPGNPSGSVPQTVHLVCLGATSKSDYVPWMLTKGCDPLADEIWTLNRGVRVFACDLLFVLDEIHEEAMRDPDYGSALAAHEGPIISTTARGRFEHVHRYPARWIMDQIGLDPLTADPYWRNSVPMILAYALAIGVKRLCLWGADYTDPNGNEREHGRANTEYWIGFCRARGMDVGLSSNTTLLDRRAVDDGQLVIYGLRNQREARAFLCGDLT